LKLKLHVLSIKGIIGDKKIGGKPYEI